MNANEFVKKLQCKCNQYAGCHDGCPFYTDEHDITCCELNAVTGYAPHNVKLDSQEEQICDSDIIKCGDSDVEHTIEQVAEESPNITINAKNVYVSFYK